MWESQLSTLHRSAVCPIDSGSWFAKVVVMSKRSTEQIRELLRSNLMTSPRAEANQNFESEEHTCQRFVSRDLVFRWTVLAQG